MEMGLRGRAEKLGIRLCYLPLGREESSVPGSQPFFPRKEQKRCSGRRRGRNQCRLGGGQLRPASFPQARLRPHSGDPGSERSDVGCAVAAVRRGLAAECWGHR